MEEQRTARLKHLIAQGMVVAPACMNAFHAKIAQMVGLQAVYMSGFGTAADRGYPNVGLVTQTEMIQNAKYICDAVEVPVICDADAGYGNPINVWRTVREYEKIGVAGIHLEDQLTPKDCNFLEGKQVIPMEDHVQKIRAALDARKDKDFLIIARSDALAVNGWGDTMRRCRAYTAAGADLVFVDGVSTLEDLNIYARDLADLPKLYNGMLLPNEQIAKMGFKIMIAGAALGVVFTSVRAAFEQIKGVGYVSTHVIGPGGEEIPKLLDLPNIQEMERRYAAST